VAGIGWAHGLAEKLDEKKKERHAELAEASLPRHIGY
jgi:hypothetical protein